MRDNRRDDWRIFASGAALAEALATDVADALERGISQRGGASLAVSGGSTPGPFFDALSRIRIDWAKVAVTLVDERFVAPSSERSNERLARTRLLVEEARLARFVGLFAETEQVADAARRAEAGVALLPRPLDAVVLGMGTDGHTASFFPDAPNLSDLTDPGQRRLVMPVEAPSGGEPRLTLTLPVLSDARFLALHIEGARKRAVLEEASPSAPIRRVLDAAASTPHIYWSA